MSEVYKLKVLDCGSMISCHGVGRLVYELMRHSGSLAVFLYGSVCDRGIDEAVFSRVSIHVHAGKGVGVLCICLPISSVLSSSAFPQWISTINDSQLDSGDQLHWECKATGIPRPTYRWLRNGELITPQVLTHRFPRIHSMISAIYPVLEYTA